MYKIIKIMTAALICLALSACEKEKSSSAESPAVPVNVALPTIRDITVYVESVGNLDHSYYLKVSATQSGILEKIYVKEGALVEAGTPLFKIDSKARVIRQKEAEAQLFMDQVTYEAAKKKSDRLRPLAEKDLISQIEWEELELSKIKTEATVLADKARLEGVKLDVDLCTLYAPASGRLGRIDIQEGSLLSSEQVLTTLTRIDPLFVNFSLSEKDYGKLPKGPLTFELQLLCNQGCKHEGKVTFLNNNFDSKSGLLALRGELDNPEGCYLPGQSVTVRVPIAVNPQKILVPLTAIKYNQQGPYVYAVSDENTISFRQLILGEEQGTDVVVREGISENEAIIISGHARLSPGTKVEVQ